MDETCLTVTTLAYDGVEGWGIYQKMKPDIVYTDYHMPIMDGGQFAKKIAEYSYQPKAIFLVSNDPRSIEPNITRYINKKDVMDLFFQMKKKEMESKKQPGPPTF
jgi:CheY-like chemotaxis protein